MGDPGEVATGLGKPATALGREMETMPPSSLHPPALNPSLWGLGIGSDKSNIQSPAFV